jgi:hypothetical protein
MPGGLDEEYIDGDEMEVTWRPYAIIYMGKGSSISLPFRIGSIALVYLTLSCCVESIFPAHLDPTAEFIAKRTA